MEDNLTECQKKALSEIMGAYSSGDHYILSGSAGTGKTFLMQQVAREFHKRGRSIVMTAPTHKAVAVLNKKMKGAGLDFVECRTIHSLLSLKPKAHGDRQIFERQRHAKPVMQSVIVCDEASMIGADLHQHIKRHLPVSFVLFSGDPAQLPPVGEKESVVWANRGRSHLAQIVRQEADNPILSAATRLRDMQASGEFDYHWARPARNGDIGVFVPDKASAHDWMRKGFLSDEYAADPDNFRYLAWTNAKVATVNRMVQKWRYGEKLNGPFMEGERVIFRAPVFENDQCLFQTNEEVDIKSIALSSFSYQITGANEWTVKIDSYQIEAVNSSGAECVFHIPRNDRDYQAVLKQIADEAADFRPRWQQLHDFKSAMGQIQCAYALTVHTSQGSTHGTTFVDLADISRRASDNQLETLQLCYTAMTRPSKRAVII